jgi:2-keto-3-deoxy-L-rhamnonate aldolase RhmA
VRARWIPALLAITLPSLVALHQGAKHVNPVVELLSQKKPVFGLYSPSNRRPRGDTSTVAPKTPAQLAAEVIAHTPSDFAFDGSMEGDWDKGYAGFTDFAKGMQDGGSPAQRWAHPLAVKTHKISENPTLAAERIGKALDLGVSNIMFVEVESAEELKAGLAAMRFKSKGGTRPETVGNAPAYWGMSEKEYKAKADLWPLSPNGELTNWTIVESKEGLAHLREIAAVPGIGVLWPGAGTLRGVFTTTDADGKRTFDEKGWEGAIQQVLAACKEFKIPCGFPANANDIELRMKQGFSVFVMNWGDPGFKTVDLGMKAAGR